MGLILAIFEVALPDDESHFNVISITILENAENCKLEKLSGKCLFKIAHFCTRHPRKSRRWRC